MAMKILEDECTGCGVCVDECPNDAISEAGDVYKIDPAKCTECEGVADSPQCKDVCPVEDCIVKA